MTQIDDILELVRTGAIIPETNVAILAMEVERLRAVAFGEWIAVADRLPEDQQDVLFIIQCTGDEWNNGRVLAGRYTRWGFSHPGITWAASHWMPIGEVVRSAAILRPRSVLTA